MSDLTIKVLRVFIASPGDLAPERAELRKIVDTINKIYAKGTSYRIELLGWEDTLPGQGRPQELINLDLDKSDLFIGCLYQRWGTDTGNNGQTGFEEEFNRALDRRNGHGVPDIWLYLKKVDNSRLADPGEQLVKVLSFKKKEENAKRLLFKEFESTQDWGEMVSYALHCEMLKLTQALRGQEPDGENSSAAAIAKNHEVKSNRKIVNKDKVTEIFQSIVKDLKESGKQLVGVLEESKKIRSERLLLYAATNYEATVLSISFSVHEMNRIYLNRSEHLLTMYEKIFLLRCAILDSDELMPAWYWLDKSNLKIENVFRYFCTEAYDADVRRGAINFATRIGFRLNKGRVAKDRPVEKALNDTADSVKLEALSHLAIYGINRDLNKIEALLGSSSSLVRDEAERCLKKIRIRLSPNEEIKRLFEQFEPFDADLVKILTSCLSKVDSDILWKGVAHSNESVVALVVRELSERGEINNLKKIELLDKKESHAVKECVYLAKIDLGFPIDFPLVRSSLRSYSYGTEKIEEKADADKVISRYFNDLKEDELWAKVYLFDDNSHVALRCLGEFRSDSAMARVKELLHDGFRSTAEKAKVEHARSESSYGFFNRNDSIEAARKKLVKYGFKILSDNAIVEDRELFLSSLSDDLFSSGETISCCKALQKIGRAGDADSLKKIWSSGANQFTEAVAAKAFLHLAGSSRIAIIELLENVSEKRLWIVVSHLLEVRDGTLWDRIKPHLYDVNSGIRRIACYYAIKTLSKEELEHLLKEYQSPASYYYDVVTILDRICYSPDELVPLFMQMERKSFEDKSPQWDAFWQF